MGRVASGACNDNSLHYQTSKMPRLKLAAISLVGQGMLDHRSNGEPFLRSLNKGMDKRLNLGKTVRSK